MTWDLGHRKLTIIVNSEQISNCVYQINSGGRGGGGGGWVDQERAEQKKRGLWDENE